VNVLQLHGSVGGLTRLGRSAIYYLVANFVQYKNAKNKKAVLSQGNRTMPQLFISV